MELNKRRQYFFANTVEYPVPALPQSLLSSVGGTPLGSPLGFPTSPNFLVDMDLLHKFCSKGIPDLPGYRPTCWKLLLGYLPPDKRDWASKLSQQRKEYYDFVKDLVEGPGHQFPLSDESRTKLRSLRQVSASKKEEVALMEQIDLDVRRTLADHSFFQQPVRASSISLSSSCTSPGSVSPTLSPSFDKYDSAIASSLDFTPTSFDLQERKGDPVPPPHHLESKRPHPIQTHSYSHRSTRSEGLIHSPSLNLNPNVWSPKPTPSPMGTPWGLELDANRLSEDFGTTLHLTSSTRSMSESTFSQSSEPPLDYHWEALERILYIYAKLNPGVGYVQGMNEILGPLYYVCAHDREDCPLDSRSHAEADAFYLFTAVMGSIRDQFVKQLDHDSRVGVQATLKVLESKLFQVAPDLAEDLEQKGLNSAFYAFRWITLLGAQEFDLPDVIRLWDALLSHTPLYLGTENGLSASSYGLSTSPLNSMIMVCVAMLCLTRPLLLGGSFTDNLKLLQNYPPLYDIATIVDLAYHIEALPPGTSLDFQHFVVETRETAHLGPRPSDPAPADRDTRFSWRALAPVRTPPPVVVTTDTTPSVHSPRPKPTRHRHARSTDLSSAKTFAHRLSLNLSPPGLPSASTPTSWFRAQAARWM